MDNYINYNSDNYVTFKGKTLFEKLEKLDNESTLLFDEIIDLKTEQLDYQKLKNSYNKLIKLLKLYLELKKIVSYIEKTEASSFMQISQKFLFKIFLTLNVTFFAFMANPILGIISFVSLNKKAINDFTFEISEWERFMDKYDIDDRLETIKIVLGNCYRLYNGIITQIDETQKLELSDNYSLIKNK